MERIKAGSFGREVGKKDMAFCIIYCDSSTPYENYEQGNMMPGCYIDMVVPRVFMQSRGKDGKIGFPGGNVDPEDTCLLDAVIRELEEEINFIPDSSRLIPFATFADDRKHITSFTYRVSDEELKTIFKHSLESPHFGAEVNGCMMTQIHSYATPSLLNHVYSGTALDELKLIIEEKHLVIDQAMLDKALELVKPYFISKKRLNGNNYYDEHILGTVEMMKDKPLEYKIVMALHDALEDTPITREDLLQHFPEFIVEAVEDLTLNPEKDEKEEVAKCLKTPLAQYCRYIDRLNNLQHTSVRYNTLDMVEKMITKTQAYYLPVFTKEQIDVIMQELNRLDYEFTNVGEINV
jgi:8-oxo-dGTP pyrophosphatase MutT (NUDIX family)